MERVKREDAKARTRLRLLDAAERLFLESGYAFTPMEQIASAAGVTKAAIYRHFPSKEDLFLALRERSSSLMDTSPLLDASVGVKERLAEIGRAVAEMTQGTDPRVIAMHLEFRAMALRRPEARARMAEELRTHIAAAAGATSAEDIRLRAGVTDAEVLILGQLLVDGLREYRAYAPDVVTEATFATALSLLAGLLALPSPPST
jgi:AcrR family transcriptional regulator